MQPQAINLPSLDSWENFRLKGIIAVIYQVEEEIRGHGRVKLIRKTICQAEKPQEYKVGAIFSEETQCCECLTMLPDGLCQVVVCREKIPFD